MDFETYRSRVFVFYLVFATVGMCTRGRETLTEEGIEVFIDGIRKWLDAPIDDIDKGYPIEPLNPGELLLSLDPVKDLNLYAPDEELVAQAEKIKQSIIDLGRGYRQVVGKHLRSTCKATHKMPAPKVMVDFIRDSGGKVIIPFDYWRDCIEVYLQSHLKGLSNIQIAKTFNFRSSRSGTDRARLDLVKKMLEEAEELIEAVTRNEFPPTGLKGTKQQTVIN